MATVDELIKKFKIPPAHRKVLDPGLPLAQRLLAAKGLAPLPPKVTLAVQYLSAAGHLGDEQVLKEAAHAALHGMPASILASAIDDRTHPKILEFVILERDPNSQLDEVLAMRHQLNRSSALALASRIGARELEILCSNQQLLLCFPEILAPLRANPSISRTMLDRVESFLRLSGLDIEELAAASPGEAADALPQDEVSTDLASISASLQEWMAGHPLHAVLTAIGVRLRPEHFWGGQRQLDLEAERQREEAQQEGQEGTNQAAPGAFTFGLEDDADLFEELLLSGEDGEDDEQHVDSKTSANMEAKIREMAAGEKIKLAYVGNAETRMILIKDSNKVVSEAVVKSGRMTDREVVRAASSRAISEDIIRGIGRNKEWLRNYHVKHALVCNPKCPIQISMALLHTLNDRDIRQLAKNRNISPVIQKAAAKKVKQKDR